MLSISFGTAFDAGSTLVPRPAAGIMAFLTFKTLSSLIISDFNFYMPKFGKIFV